MAWLALARARAEQQALSDLKREHAQRIAAENQLRQAQKMEAVGQLTGGIAHDFNNLLAVITGSLELVQRRIARGDTDVGRFIAGALDGTDRAAKLTHRLLAFARQQPLEPRPTDPNRLVGGMIDLLRRTLGETVRVETRLMADPPAIFVDQNQLENAILNLAVNARDAMPGGGKLALETAHGTLDDGTKAVSVTVRDSGTGMPPDVVARAFEPFFTTKPQGRGTGLGLSQVYGFVTQSGGRVRIDSQPGQGTAIELTLPVSADGVPAETAGRGSLAGPLPGRSRQTVLVVEDDAAVRLASAETIGELGYRTVTATDGAAALAVLDSERHVAVLFTDVVMPGIDGPTLAAEARRRRPDLRVIFATGHPADDGQDGPRPGPARRSCASPSPSRPWPRPWRPRTGPRPRPEPRPPIALLVGLLVVVDRLFAVDRDLLHVLLEAPIDLGAVRRQVAAIGHVVAGAVLLQIGIVPLGQGRPGEHHQAAGSQESERHRPEHHVCRSLAERGKWQRHGPKPVT